MTDAALRGATVESLFASAGALLDGHFLLKSGRHAGRYLAKFLVLQHPRYGVELCRRFADVLAPSLPTLVVGPTTGGSSSRSRRRVNSVDRPVLPLPSRILRVGGRCAVGGSWRPTSASCWSTTS